VSGHDLRDLCPFDCEGEEGEQDGRDIRLKQKKKQKNEKKIAKTKTTNNLSSNQMVTFSTPDKSFPVFLPFFVRPSVD